MSQSQCHKALSKINSLRDELTPDMSQFGAWSEPFKASNFQQALKEVQGILNTDPNNLEARLAWVACQVELKNVPAAALTSPLQEIKPRVQELEANSEPTSQPIMDLAINTYLAVAERLVSNSNFRTTALTMEEALSLLELRKVNGDSVTKLQQSLAIVLQEEISQAEDKDKPIEHVQSLQTKLEALKASIAEFEAENKAENKAKSKAKNKPDEEPDTNQSNTDNHLASEVISEQTEDKKSTFFPLLGKLSLVALGAVLMLVLGLLPRNTFFGSSASTPTLEQISASNTADAAMNDKQSEQTSAEATTASQNANNKAASPQTAKAKDSRLAALSERLNKLINKSGDAAEPKTEERLAADPEVDQETLAAMNQQAANTDNSSERETDQDSGVEKFPAKPNDNNKTPSIDPKLLSKNEVKSLGVAEGLSKHTKLSKHANGRLYGPPPSLKDSVTLQGQPVRPMMVEEYRNAKLYMTIVSTRVLAAPSMLSKPITTLSPDTKVYATSKMGQWLEIRSSGGKRGYIFAQDVVETFDGGEHAAN
ncbi:hypothetical protein BVY02_01330 [bacterium J17]|nr:hypothetical protein BVY02_01330 [bacterium J17]